MLHARMLRYLDEVARAGSIRKAASRLNVASSAVNRQILALEQELGTPIFERLTKRLRLTATGELLIAHVRRTLKEHDRVRAQIEDLKGLRRGTVTIATMGGLAPAVLPPIIANFRRRHNGVQVIVRALPVGEIVAAVAAGEIDVGFGFDLPPDAGLRSFATLSCRLGAVVAPDHALAGRPSVTLADCIEHPLILPDAGITLRHLLDAAFTRAALAAEPAIESNSIELIKRAAVLGLGVTFLNAINIDEERRRGELVFVPVRSTHLKPQILSVVVPAKGSSDVLASLVAEALRDCLGELEGGAR